MSIATKRTITGLWHYRCPQCGFTDAELGHHASDEMIYCEICLEDERHVRLKRWPADDLGAAPAPPAWDP